MRTITVLVWVATTAAWAGSGDAVAGALIQVTAPTTAALLGASSQATTQGSRSGDSTVVSRRDCEQNADCHDAYVCQAGYCVAPAAPVAVPVSLPVDRGGVDAKCGADADCADGLACLASFCAPANPAARCKADNQCGSGQVCAEQRCVSLPPPPPEASLRWKGTEVLLRGRAVELREELLLGTGPVVHALALSAKLPEAPLTKALRTHRKELVALIGDGADPQWSTRFLRRVDALIAG